MPFESQRAKLKLSAGIKEKLTLISRSHTESIQQVQRSKMMLAYEEGKTISEIARRLHTNRPKVERCIAKALQLGALAALEDLPRAGKPATLTEEAKTWLISLACQKPKELGYSYELWTTSLLAQHARKNAQGAGHLSLSRLNRGTVSKILSKSKVRPHKITYYLQRRDPQFDEKMAQVLMVYKEVEMLRDKEGHPPCDLVL